jgi:hypothetical protein
VHRIVSDDEQANVEPADEDNHQRGRGNALPRQAVEEQGVDMQRQPARQDRQGEDHSDDSLVAHG